VANGARGRQPNLGADTEISPAGRAWQGVQRVPAGPAAGAAGGADQSFGSPTLSTTGCVNRTPGLRLPASSTFSHWLLAT